MGIKVVMDFSKVDYSEIDKGSPLTVQDLRELFTSDDGFSELMRHGLTIEVTDSDKAPAINFARVYWGTEAHDLMIDAVPTKEAAEARGRTLTALLIRLAGLE